MNKKIIPIIISLVLVLGLFLPIQPVYSGAGFPVVRTGIIPPDYEFLKELTPGASLDSVVELATKQILQKFLEIIKDKIQTSGYDNLTGLVGSTPYVKNWRNFLLNGQYRGEEVWRGIVQRAIDSGDVCKHIVDGGTLQALGPAVVPFQFLDAHLRVDSLQDVFSKVKCDPNLTINQVEKFKAGNWEEGGGWTTFNRLLSANNRPEGVRSILFSELEKQRKIEQEADRAEAVSGGGFTSKKTCISFSSNNKCVAWADIKTPGKLLEGGMDRILEQNLKSLNEIKDANIGALVSSLATAIPAIINIIFQ